MTGRVMPHRKNLRYKPYCPIHIRGKIRNNKLFIKYSDAINKSPVYLQHESYMADLGTTSDAI